MAKKRSTARRRGGGSDRLRLFVGSSSEAMPVLRAIEQNLHHDYEVTPWTAGGVFEPGHTPLQDLERLLGRMDRGVFVFTPDDAILSRGKRSRAVRDNVLVELGVFIGRFGSEACFAVAPSGATMKTMTDLIGFTPVQYDHDRFKRDQQGARACGGASV